MPWKPAGDRANVVIDTIKQAEDSADWIVRLYESHGARAHVQLSSPLPVQSVHRTNLLEEEEAPLVWQDGSVSFDIQPFKIITLKLKL